MPFAIRMYKQNNIPKAIMYHASATDRYAKNIFKIKGAKKINLKQALY
jgi:hypothetical protein